LNAVGSDSVGSDAADFTATRQSRASHCR
jgi:hypothetical protein